jgi:formamidopyrimidine-DNA glycosylase
VKKLHVLKVRYTKPWIVKVDFDFAEEGGWSVRSQSRGKEAKLIFEKGKEKKELVLYFFKGGRWEWYANENATLEDPVYEQDLRFSIYLEDGSIVSLQDKFHQSFWKWCSHWGYYRSPDIVLEHNEYRKYIFEHRNHSMLKLPIYNLMMRPKWFNGVNNFSRCEILARVHFSPFTPMSDVLEVEDLREELFEVSKTVLEDIYLLGGMQFGIWKNPFGVNVDNLNRWKKVYARKWQEKLYTDNKKLYINEMWKNELNIFKRNEAAEREAKRNDGTNSDE